jgi:hypothetical protein
MTAARAAKLEALGFAWELSARGSLSNDTKWEAQLARLAAYKAEHGDCSVPKRCAEDLRLGSWVSNQRKLKRKLDRGEPSNGMTAERAAKLEAFGFAWSCRSEASPVSTAASDGDAPAPAPRKTKAKEPKKNEKALSSRDGDAALRKENKKLEVAAKKAKTTADNLKKKMKQDGQALKAQQAENKAHQEKIKTLEDEIKSLKQSDPERNPKPAPTDSTPVPDTQP